jgi:tRNA-binding EMAP/Myf-like protein
MHKQLKAKRQFTAQSHHAITKARTTKKITTKKSTKTLSSRSITTFSQCPIQQQPHQQSQLKSTLKSTTKRSKPTTITAPRTFFSTETTTATVITPPDMTQEFYKLDLRVALLQNVRNHPGADSLYLIDCHVGEEVPRQLVSNVKPYMSIEKLTNRQQIVLANLKPVGFRGEKSFAMMLGCSPKLPEGETPPPPVLDAQNGLAEPRYTPSNTQIFISEGDSTPLPANATQFKPGQRLYLDGQSPVAGEIARVNDKAIAKLFGELGTDVEGNLTYLGKSVVFGPVDAPVKVNLGIPDAKLF